MIERLIDGNLKVEVSGLPLFTITTRIFSIKFHHFQHFQPKFFNFIVMMLDFSFHYMKTKEKH